MNKVILALALMFVCLFCGCAGDNKPDFKVAVRGDKAGLPLKVDVRSDPNEPNQPIIIKTQGDKALLVEVKLDYIAVGVLIFSAIIAIATAFAAYFVWRAASRVAKR